MVRSPTPAEFDLCALQAAVDAGRRSRGLGWTAAAREIGVSVGTLRGLGTRRAVEGDGVLQILLWLGRSPESFVPGCERDDPSAPLHSPRAGVLRFDARALHTALQERRTQYGMTWAQVAAAIGGMEAGALMRLRGGGRVSFPQVMRVCAWLGQPAARFVHVAPR